MIHSTSEGRRATTAVAVLATAAVSSLLLAALGAASTPEDRFEYPTTAAGGCAETYFKAFNSNDDQTMQKFLEQYRAPSYLEDLPPEKLLIRYQRLREIFGRLKPLRVALSLDFQLTILADAAETDDVLVMRFQLEETPPHWLAFVTLSGIDHAQVPDEFGAYVATRAAPVDDVLRDTTIQSVAEVLRSSYVAPDLGRQMADSILTGRSTGRYATASKAGKLADMLTEDAVFVSNDEHVWVEAQNPMLQESTDTVLRPLADLRRDNYGFQRVEVLEGNIGYVKVDWFHDSEEAQQTAAHALAFVSHCDALIFDLRENIGGQWGSAALMLGYFLPAGQVIAHVVDRDGHRVMERSTPDEIPGEPFDDELPVYILTSGETGSAAEAFAYALKNLGRATVVGEVTRGMAHPSKEVIINDYFRISVPYLRSENLVTGTDWEGTGVVPQIETSADGALEAATEHVLRRRGFRTTAGATTSH